ncbi:hypothetical protein [Mycobacterium sp. SMC-4]|uniref:hypothetical protein n=1 Tax=Mycobacterium sp. SMC-4 TaxID=2857059 RepID=UPI003D0303B8
MNTIATKFKVGTAAAAMAASAVIAPVAASAAPAVQVPAAPVQQVAGGVAQAPGDFIWFFQVSSVQIAGALTRTATYWTDVTIMNYQRLLEANPNSIFAPFFERRLEQLASQRANFGELSFSVCRNGEGVSAGPYGTVTRGSC